MKKYPNSPILLLFFAFFFIVSISFSACSKDEVGKIPEDKCYVHLFDGENYKGDNIIIDGPGEFANLKSLPGTRKDWDDEADSFKSGENTTVIFWTRTDFRGDSIVYKNGAKKASIDEPRSMKIICGR
jgi:hypothetical protein